MLKLFSQIKRFVLDLLLPIECLNCSQPGEYFCTSCQAKLKINNLENSMSLSTNLKRHNLEKVFIAGDYDDPLLQDLIIKYKYNFLAPLSDSLSKFLSDFWKKNNLDEFLNNQQPLLIPMPLSKKRLRWRGFNQADRLTENLAERFGYKISCDLSRRHRRPQAELNEQQRLKNLSGAFNWRGKSLAGKTVIIIDDVITTGTTIDEAAGVLKKAGASQVWALALAKG